MPRDATPIFFPEKENGRRPSKRKAFRLAVSGLNDLCASGMRLPARGVAALGVARRFASAPIIRCRSAHLVEVQPNFRLPEHLSMRRAPAMPHSASSLPPSKRHSRLTIVRRGCCQITTRRDSWRSHVHRTHTAQRVQSFKLQTHNVRGRGGRPLVLSLGGYKGGYSLSRKRVSPFYSRPPCLQGTLFLHRMWKSLTPWYGRKKRQLFCSARCRWRTLSHSAYPGARCG